MERVTERRGVLRHVCDRTVESHRSSISERSQLLYMSCVLTSDAEQLKGFPATKNPSFYLFFVPRSSKLEHETLVLWETPSPQGVLLSTHVAVGYCS